MLCEAPTRVAEEPSSEAFVVVSELVVTPSLPVPPASELSVGFGTGTIGFGVVDSVDSV